MRGALGELPSAADRSHIHEWGRLRMNLLTAAGVGKRKLAAASKNTEWLAELEAEIDEELREDNERERERNRSQGPRLAVVGSSEALQEDEELLQGSSADGASGLRRAIQVSAMRAKQRQMISTQWIKFVQDVQAGRAL
jgi:hypothetical protein